MPICRVYMNGRLPPSGNEVVVPATIPWVTVMGWTAPRAASTRQDGRCHTLSEAGRLLRNRLGKPSMGKSIKNLPSCAIIGLDVAKNPHPEFESRPSRRRRPSS